MIFDHCIAYRIAENSPELCSDGIDNDADGVKDCDALSCRHYDVCMGGGKVGEDTLEKCSDGIDNDGDTLVDCNDVECKEFQHCLGIKSPDISKETCESGIDADGDGLVGCADPDCQQFTDICSDLCPDDPYKYAPDKCPCGKTWVEDASFPEGGACFINISTPEEFARIAEVKPEDVEAGIAQGWGQSDNYILKRSIDFGETSSYVPAREFEGILEGNNKRIAGVFAFDGSKFEEYQKFGLFQRTETATFRNMILGITLNIANAPQYTSAGALMGTTGGSAHLENITGISKVYVKVKNKLAIPQNYNKMIDIKVGGLAGSLDGADTLHNVYLHGSNTTVEIDITQIFDNDKCTETKISNYFYYTCTLDASEKTINVGGIAGNSSLIDAENVHAFTNVTLISNLDLTTYEKYHYGDTFGPQSFKPIEFRVGGIAGTGYDLENFHSSGTISVNTNTKIDQSSHIYSSKKYIYAASTTRVGGIAGFSSNISDSSFSGDIIVAADDERSDNNYNYGNIESKADGYACVGGIVGGAANYGYNDAVFNGLYAKGNISIEPKCKSNSYENSVPTYGGGIIGCAFSDQNAYIINSYADMALTLEPSSCAKDTFRWGGIVSVMPRPQNASKQYKQYIVNNHAYTTFRFPQWGKYENVSLGGITSTNSDGYIVNNFVSGSFSGDETHENMAFYKAKLNATRGKYLYESYWNAAVYGDSAKSSGSQITDGSAKPFTFNAAKIPVISTNETVLGLLSANSGHNGGVLSVNIPRFKDDAELYADWKAIADKDGNQIPVPISKTGKY